MALRLITPPIGEVLSLEAVKQHLRVVDSDEDALIAGLIVAAREFVEGPDGLTGRLLLEQTWELVLDAFPEDEDGDEIQIPLAPLRSIVSIKYDDADGVEQTIDAGDYTVDAVSVPGLVAIDESWPTPLEGRNAVRVRFVAGYPLPDESPSELTDNVPQAIKQAMLMIIAHWYEHRESVVVGVAAQDVPEAAKALLERYKVFV